jgi:acyl-CoA hydrolase
MNRVSGVAMRGKLINTKTRDAARSATVQGSQESWLQGEGEMADKEQSIPPLERGHALIAHRVFPGQSNTNGTLFGGEALRWMDEAAGIAAGRCARKAVVTAAMDRVEFHVPIMSGALVETIARVTKIGRTSMQVIAEVWTEDLFNGERTLATSANFVMVAVDDDGRPTPVETE